MRTAEVGRRAALVAAVALSVVSLAGVAWATPVLVSELSDKDTDVEIFMAVDATPDQVAAVERAIRGSDDVARFRHLTKNDAYEEFTRIFARKQDLINSVAPDALPESFRVDLRQGVRRKEWGRPMDSLTGVDTVVYPRVPNEREMLETIRSCKVDTNTADLEVFMNVNATETQLEAAEAAVRGEAGMTVARVLDQHDAYEEFKRIFADKPKKVRSITAADLPPSIRIRVAGPVSQDAVERLGAIDGVDTVTERGAMCAAIRAALAKGYTAKQLARLFVQYAETGALPS